jgi:hypothetical protein
LGQVAGVAGPLAGPAVVLLATGTPAGALALAGAPHEGQ